METSASFEARSSAIVLPDPGVNGTGVVFCGATPEVAATREEAHGTPNRPTTPPTRSGRRFQNALIWIPQYVTMEA